LLEFKHSATHRVSGNSQFWDIDKGIKSFKRW
jgi:hypothetical protein